MSQRQKHLNETTKNLQQGNKNQFATVWRVTVIQLVSIVQGEWLRFLINKTFVLHEVALPVISSEGSRPYLPRQPLRSSQIPQLDIPIHRQSALSMQPPIIIESLFW